MIEIYLKYDNMHTFGMINALNCINNHVNSFINSMLSIIPKGFPLTGSIGSIDDRKGKLLRMTSDHHCDMLGPFNKYPKERKMEEKKKPQKRVFPFLNPLRRELREISNNESLHLDGFFNKAQRGLP